MIISDKTITKLRFLINEETEYRSGPALVKLFNHLGFNDEYGQGFPSRWAYTEEKLTQINGTPELDKCIKMIFSPINFINNFDNLKHHIDEFNQYLTFDGWKVTLNNTDVVITKSDKINIILPNNTEEDDFLKQEFNSVTFTNLQLESQLTEVLDRRLNEIKKAHTAKAYLSAIILAGSTLEGILLGISCRYTREYNSSSTSPKDKAGKVKPLPSWSLRELIDVSHSVGMIKEDVKKFSHSLRDFRNYIHPLEQMRSGFFPDEHTSKICLQVLKAAIHQIQTHVRST